MADPSGWISRKCLSTDVPTPVTGKVHLFNDSADGIFKYKDEFGVVNTFPSVASVAGNTGAVTAGQLATALDPFFLTPAEGNAAYQALDATLSALAAADWQLNRFPIGTGTDTLTQTAFAPNTFPARSSSGNLVAKTITDYGLSLIDDADAATARSTLGLGTAATTNSTAYDPAGTGAAQAAAAQAASQPLDATLTALAAADWAANTLPIGTGANTLSQTSFVANTFPARSSSGNLIAKAISDSGFSFLSAADVAAETALLNSATSTLKGLLSPAQFNFLTAFSNSVEILVTQNQYSNLACNGSTDDTAALNALLSAAPDSSTLVWPGQGVTMVISSAISIPAGKHFRFIGGGDNNKTVFLQTSPTADHFTLNDWYSTFENIHFSTNYANTTASQALTSGTVLSISGINTAFVAASGSITVGSTAGWQVLNYSARTSTTVTLSSTGTGSSVIGIPLVFKTAGAAINAGNYVGINVSNCTFTCVYNGYICAGTTSNQSSILSCGFLNTINFDIQVDAANWNGIIEDNTADCTINSRTLCHLEINQVGSVTGGGNQWIRGQYNMRLGSTTAAYPAGVFGVYFDDTFYDNAGIDAVRIYGISAVQRVKLTSCWLSSAAGNGLNLASTASTLPTGIDLINCDIYANAGSGIAGNGAQDLNILGGRIAGNTTAGVNSFVPRLSVNSVRIGPTAGFGANGTGIILPAGAYSVIQLSNNDLTGNTTSPLTDSSTSATVKRIYENAGLVSAPPTQVPNLLITVAATPTKAGVSVPFLANAARIGTTVRITCYLTNLATTAQTLTPTLRYGTTDSNADTSILTVTPVAGTAAVGSGTFVWEFTIISTTTALASYRFYNGNGAATGIMGSGSTFLSNSTPVTITNINTNAFLGAYFASTVASIVTIRSVEYEVPAQ